VRVSGVDWVGWWVSELENCGSVLVSRRYYKLVAEAGDISVRERPPLETATKQRPVETVKDCEH
jgi:hypothetical protein